MRGIWEGALWLEICPRSPTRGASALACGGGAVGVVGKFAKGVAGFDFRYDNEGSGLRLPPRWPDNGSG